MQINIEDRKEPIDDATVQQKIEELKAAIRAVNGDESVKSLIIYADILISGNAGSAVVAMDICNCGACLERAAEVLGMAFEKADAQAHTQNMATPGPSKH